MHLSADAIISMKEYNKLMGKTYLRGITLLLFFGLSLSCAYAKKPKYYKESGIAYMLYEDHAEVTQLKKGVKYTGNIVIPSHVKKGKIPVTAIGKCAFQNSTELKSVLIPETVEKIMFYAFCGCKGLKEVSIPNGVRIIDNGAFRDCEQLTRVILPQSLNQIDGRTFTGCRQLTSVVVDENNPYFYSKDLRIYSKDGTKLLRDFSRGSERYCVEEGVEEIDKDAFSNISGVKEFVFPKSVRVIPRLNGFPLVNIEVEEGNQNYYVQDGVLYNRTTKTLSCYPNEKEGETFIVPEGVERIGYKGFSGNDRIKNVIMPDGITEIDYYAFSSCDSLYYVEIPESVKEIGQGAFEGCKSLRHIYIPDGVQSIGAYAFKGCQALEELIIPSTVTDVGSNAFEKCNLNPLVFESTSLCESDYGIDFMLEGMNPQTKIVAHDANITKLSKHYNGSISTFYQYAIGIDLKELFNKAYNMSDTYFQDKYNLYMQVIEYDENNAQGYQSIAYNNIGVIFQNAGDRDEARRYYEKALSIDPNYKTAKSNLNSIKSEVRMEKLNAVINVLNAMQSISSSSNTNYNNSYNQGSNYSSGSSSSSSGKGRTQVTCRFCKGTGRTAGRTYTSGSSGNKGYCQYCDKVDYTHVHKHCSYCKGTGHVYQ